MRVTSRLAIRVFHLYFKDFIEEDVKVFDTDKSLTPQPPTTSPPNPLSERRGGVQGTVRLGMTKRFPQTIGVSR